MSTRTLHQQERNTDSSGAHGTFPGIDRKTYFDARTRSEILQSMFSDHSGMKPEIQNREKSGKLRNAWELKNRNAGKSLGALMSESWQQEVCWGR